MNPFQSSSLRSFNSKNPFRMIDVGASGGIDPVFLTLLKSGNSKTVGFEPGKDNFEKLKSSDKIEYRQIAVGSQEGEAEFYSCNTVSSLYRRKDREDRYGEKYERYTVKVDSIDNMRQKGQIDEIDLLKIDVEGHEHEVLKGAKNALESEVLALKTEFSFGIGATNSFEILKKTLDESGFIFFNFSIHEKVYGALLGGDAIFFKDIEKILSSGISDEQKRNQSLNLIIITSFLNYREYAYICCQKAFKANLISHEEASEISNFLTSEVYLPDMFPKSNFKFAFSKLLFLLVQIFSGRLSDKSKPTLNQIARSSRLWFPKNKLPKSDRIQARWDKVLEVYEKYDPERGQVN